MIKAIGPRERRKSLRNKYLPLVLALSALCIGQVASAQGFPNTDSLRRYNNRYIRNSAVEAFSQLRLNTLLHGVINWIDSARAGEGGSLGIDTIYAVNDSTIRYIDNGQTRNVTIKGTGGRKVDTLYKANDSTLRYQIGNDTYDVLVGSYSTSGATKEYVDSLISTIEIGSSIPIGYGLVRSSDAFEPYEVDTLPENNGLITYSKLYLTIDSLGALIGGPDDTAEVDAGYGLIESPANTLSVDTLSITTFGRVYHIIDSIADAITAATFPDLIGQSGISAAQNSNGDWVITCTGCAAGSNPLNAIVPAGLISDAVVPGSGNNATGTNNTPFLQAAINSAASGQLIVIPDGNYLFSTPLDTIKGPKRVNILILGNTYHNGSDFMIFSNASGPLEQHAVEHRGFCIGRVNMPTHSRTTYLNNTKPNWSTFTGTPFKIYNTYQVYIKFNKIEGFKNGVEIIGNDYDGAGRGSQENSIAGRWLFKNANGITLTSLNGASYCDKNVFTGWDNGTMRISGGLAIKIDGYAGTASNGEVYNGAFRSNEFHVLVELVDSIAEVHGDVTENEFDVTVEGGTATGVMGAVGFRMRSVSPNYVRDPIYNGRGVYGIAWIQNGLGINARGSVPIWNSSNGRYYANKWETDQSGNLILIGSRMTAFQRGDSPPSFNYAPGPVLEKEVSTTASTYTAAAGEYIRYNNASGTLTLPTAGSNVQKWIYVKNIHSTNSLTISNGDIASLPAGSAAAFRSDGTGWRNWTNPTGTGGGGGGGGDSTFASDAAGRYTTYKLGIGGSNSSSSTWMRFAGSTTGVSSFRMASGNHPNSPADGDEWRVAKRRFMAYNGITYEYLAVPDGGTAYQMLRRNGANDDYQHIDQPYELAYASTSTISTTTSVATSLYGGAQTLNAPLGVGDVIEMTSEGTIVIGSTSHGFQFDAVSGGSTYNLVSTALAGNNTYEYRLLVKYIVRATGSSAACARTATLTILNTNGTTPATPVVLFTSGTTTLNTTSPSFNLLWDSGGTALTFTAYNSTLEVKRQ